MTDEMLNTLRKIIVTKTEWFTIEDLLNELSDNNYNKFNIRDVLQELIDKGFMIRQMYKYKLLA